MSTKLMQQYCTCNKISKKIKKSFKNIDYQIIIGLKFFLEFLN